MKKQLINLLFILVSFVSFAQKQRTTAMFDADTTTRPKAGFYGIGIRSGNTFIVPNTGTTKRLVSSNTHFGSSGQVLYTTSTQNYWKTLSLSDIGVSGLSTNYLPKYNGSSLTNSLAFDNGTNFSIGTNTGIDSYSRLYVFGGSNGANVDARPGGGGYDQSIFDAQGSDYSSTFHSAHLRYQGIGATGTTLGYSNANLADLSYNYTGSNRAFIIRTLYNNPIVFGVDNAEVGKFTSSGLNLAGLTTSQLTATDASKNIVSLSTATYPSLTELSYVKGVTSAIQTQINGKFATPTGLTTNYLTKWNGTALDNSQIFDNGTNVGIGTGSPSVKTEISSTDNNVALRINSSNAGLSTSNYSEIQLADNASVRSYWRSLRDGSGAVIFKYNDHLRFYNSSDTEVMRITSSGNLGIGIGTYTPTSKLQVVGLPTYADNTAATSGGLTSGAFYRTSTGILMVVY